jgi:hypothetical protein
MSSTVYKQFKLTSGDEVICELVETNADSETDVIVRRAMKIITTDDLESNTRYYTFKPWVSFQDDTLDLVALNSIHIVSESTPSDTVMLHYAGALSDADKYNSIRKHANVSLKEIQENMKEMTEEEMDAFLQDKYDEAEREYEKSLIEDIDSSVSNVIPFKPKGTYH